MVGLGRKEALGGLGFDSLETQVGDGLLAHLDLANLAGHRHWEIRYEGHVSRDLEVCDLTPAPFTKLFFIELST